MIDSGAIQGLQLYTGAYSARYPERISSVTLIRTLDAADGRRTEFDLGVQELGGLMQRWLGGGDLLLSAHHGLLNLVSGDIGINGVPSYTNELSRYARDFSSGGRLTLLNLAGLDGGDHAVAATKLKSLRVSCNDLPDCTIAVYISRRLRQRHHR